MFSLSQLNKSYLALKEAAEAVNGALNLDEVEALRATEPEDGDELVTVGDGYDMQGFTPNGAQQAAEQLTSLADAHREGGEFELTIERIWEELSEHAAEFGS